MKIHSLRKYLTLCISLASGLVLTVWACAWYDGSGISESMFTPEIINQPQFQPFFRTMESPFYNGYENRHEEELARQNVMEWKSYLGNKTTDYDIDFWLHKSTLKQIDSMIFVLKGKTVPSGGTRLGSSLARCENPAKAKTFLYFIGFARRNQTFEPVQQAYWEEKKNPTPITTAEKQIAGGLSFFNGAKDAFMKERYAFQMVRLYFHTGNYQSAVTFYDNNQKVFAQSSSLKWRTLGYKAAALYRMQRYSESNVLYADIYDNFPAHKQSAYLSFHPQAENEWMQTLALAKTLRQKEVLWQLQGLYANSITAMREILALNPKSEYADLLLVRAVNIQEEKFSHYFGEAGNAPTVDEKLLTFLNEISAGNLGRAPACWDLGAAYLNYLKGDFVTGDKQLAKAKTNCKGYLLEQQYNIISLAGKLARIKKLDKASEENLAPEVKSLITAMRASDKELRTNAAFNNVQHKLFRLYLQNGEYEKAENTWPGQQGARFDSIANIKKMIAYYDEKEHSDIEKAFYNYGSVSKGTYEDLLAVRLTQEGKLEEALTLYKNGSTRSLLANPFTIHIKDCHDCDFESFKGTPFTTGTFLEKMLEIRNTAIKNPAEAAQNYFLLANGYYNITYFGNARLFNSTDVYSGFYNYKDTVVAGQTSDLALRYYLLAKEKSTNKEFRAKCTFMASKCELNRYYTNNGGEDGGDYKAGRYFDSLKTNYGKTNYYKEVIKECSYFRIYATGKK